MWTHRDFEGRKQHAKILLPHIRFSQLRQDYLLDIVKKEGEMAYPEEVTITCKSLFTVMQAKKMFAKKIIEAYVYHTTSPERRAALRLACEVPRKYEETLQKETFFWKVSCPFVYPF